jgi:hypothetical protein
MRCDKTQEFLSEYIEGRLDRPMRVAVEAHLQECHACSSDVAALKSVWTALDAVPTVEPPPDLARRITAAVHESRALQQERKRWRIELPRNWMRPFTPVYTTGLAGVAALLAVGLFFPLPAFQGSSLWSLLPWSQPTYRGGDVSVVPSALPQISVTPGTWAGDHWQGLVVVTPRRELVGVVVTATPLRPVEGRLVEVEADRATMRFGALAASRPQRFDLRLGDEAQGAQAVSVRIHAKGLTEEVRRIAFVPLGRSPRVSGPVSARMQGEDLHMALLELSAAAGTPIVVDGELSGKVTLDLQNGSLEPALQSVVTQVGGRLESTPSGMVIHDR